MVTSELGGIVEHIPSVMCRSPCGHSKYISGMLQDLATTRQIFDGSTTTKFRTIRCARGLKVIYALLCLSLEPSYSVYNVNRAGAINQEVVTSNPSSAIIISDV